MAKNNGAVYSTGDDKLWNDLEKGARKYGLTKDKKSVKKTPKKTTKK